MINKITLIILGVLLLIFIASNAKGEEIDNIKREQVAQIVIQSMMQEPDKWLADAYLMYYYKDEKMLEFVRKAGPSRETSTLAIWISNGIGSIEIQKPYIYKFSEKQQEQIWSTYRKWAEHQFVTKDFKHLTEKIFDKKVQTAQTSPTFKVPIKEEAKISKDGLKEIKTNPKKVIEREQNNNKSIVLMMVTFILGILVGLFMSKGFRKSVSKDIN